MNSSDPKAGMTTVNMIVVVDRLQNLYTAHLHFNMRQHYITNVCSMFSEVEVSVHHSIPLSC